MSARASLRLHKADHDPRAAALVALSRVLKGEADSQAALDTVLGQAGFVPTDKGLCTELVYGVLRRYLSLDWFVRRFLARPGKLPVEMLLVLIMALYEMTFLRIPPHASVAWAVQHIRHRFGKGLAGVANGTLRNMQRRLETLTVSGQLWDGADSFADEEASQACKYALPAWIVRLWRESYGEEAALAFMRASLMRPPAGLRLNRSRAGWEKNRTDLLRDSAERNQAALSVGTCALAFPGSLPWQGNKLAEEGRASRQSAASYEILEAFAPRLWPLPIWDCCAGRGGKTLALLEQGIPVALATDLSAARLHGLKQEYVRLSLNSPPCPELLARSAVDMANTRMPARPGVNEKSLPPMMEERDLYGTILLDAPCSGLGTLARRPEIRLRRTQADLENLQHTQGVLLAAVWRLLRTGGRLVYLTCTLNPGENEERIAAFIRSHAEANLIQETRTPEDSPLREFFYGAMLEKR